MIANAERVKYDAIWQVPGYAENSPGDDLVAMFAELSGCKAGETLIDLGCGTGRAGARLARDHGLKVTLFDLTDAGLEGEARGLRFVEGCLWGSHLRLTRPTMGYDYGYCCDVLEHVPPEFTMLAVANIMAACRVVFFSIATVPDQFGAEIGEPLHLTVRPFVWWRDHLAELGRLIECRDLLTSGVYYMANR